MDLKSHQVRTTIGLGCGAGMFLLLLAALVVHGGVMRPPFALALFGVSLGCLIGLLASPYNDTELKRFDKYGGVLSTFLSDYVTGKLDPVVTRVLASEEGCECWAFRGSVEPPVPRMLKILRASELSPSTLFSIPNA
jgi:hypothetical protein